MHGALLRLTGWWGFCNNRGIISAVMALTKTQRPPGGDRRRSEHSGHTHRLSHTLLSPWLYMSQGWDHFSISRTNKPYCELKSHNLLLTYTALGNRSISRPTC
ncbi:hypothetical protein CRENBAI_001762 [Crenichthys baileyi]|uniref:Uncharacterized protein n=1 Tax=Crenichthys baileyi TaxID=28760 RepID=A0AAV9R5F1_9TELE